MDPAEAHGEYVGLTLIEPDAADGLADALEAVWRRDPQLYYEDGFQEYADRGGTVPAGWASPEGPYYEKAIMCRALENTVFFASVNYAFRFPESATCVIAPSGGLLSRLPYGEEGVLVEDLDLQAATGLLARRYAPERCREGPS